MYGSCILERSVQLGQVYVILICPNGLFKQQLERKIVKHGKNCQGPVVMKKMMSACSIWQGLWAAAQERRCTEKKELESPPPSNVYN